MPSDSHEHQQQPSVRDTKANGESQSLNSEEVRAGTKIVVTHAERQAFLKTSRLGKLLGVSHLLPSVSEATQEAPEDYPTLKRLRGLLKRGEPGTDKPSSTDTEVTKRGN